MLKRIRVEQLKLGMHLKEFCGSWMEHPFIRTSFVLTDPKDIEAILACSIREVWIDTDKGLDVPAGETALTLAETEAEVQTTLPHPKALPRQTTPVPIAAEIEQASRICQQAQQAVISMFEEVRMGKAVDVGGAKHLVEEISESVARNPGAIISLARLKTADDYTYMHSVAVCAMMVALARQLGLDETQTRSCGTAGLLHDVGKIAIPNDILNKPGKLTEAEFDLMKTHPLEGHRLLQNSPGVDPVALSVALLHHEKVDSSGYPQGLRDDEISLYVKMASVCDVYDAITSNRPYKAGWDPAQSLHKMAEWSKGHFDLHVFQAFVKSMGIYPIGSLVRLSSGRIGVVTEQSPRSLTTPVVKVFFSTKSNLRMGPMLLDLSKKDTTETIINREDPQQWQFPDLHELWSGLPNLGRHF
ncbi:HD-GYP domain-containing protein [Rhodoferax sp.]|uniref:HD-GYP domain-containing protein n=1 Tax=Rhodoferax sp. TaxID=50421 RepID=UPI00260F634D|nr:HD-GYP domain-containing protein [Rhodoferax sp.]MDD2926695.1 HD-GYP domain-containing protein [Rhodoferax sp.]